MYANGNSLLEGLPPAAPTYPYQGRQQCLHIVHLEFENCRARDEDGCIILTNVNGQTFFSDFVFSDDNDFDELNGKLRDLGWRKHEFDSELQIVILEMPKAGHATMVQVFSRFIDRKAARCILAMSSISKGQLSTS